MNILDEFDVSKFALGKLCRKGHNHKNTGLSVRRIKGNACLCCQLEKSPRKRNRQCSVCGQTQGKGGLRPTPECIDKEEWYCAVCIGRITHKRCSQCDQIKPLGEFHKGNSSYIDGHKSSCRQCHKDKYEGYRSPSEIKRKDEYQKARDKKIAELKEQSHKQCSRCKELLPKEKFANRKDALDGLEGRCRNCVNEMNLNSSRKRGVKPAINPDSGRGLLLSYANEILGAQELYDFGLYYLGRVCVKGHDWHGKGYTLRGISNNHCLECERLRKKTQDCKELQAYRRWLKNPRISPSVADLVDKSERWARVYRKEYYLSPEKREEYNRKKREAYRAKYKANPEAERLRIKLYKNANPDKAAKWGDKRLKRVAKQSDGTMTKKATSQLLEKAKKCPYCSAPIDANTATIDHLIPVSKGGLHSIHNVVACCAPCNFSKGNKSFVEWLDCLDEKHRNNAAKLYERQHGTHPAQLTLPLTF